MIHLLVDGRILSEEGRRGIGRYVWTLVHHLAAIPQLEVTVTTIGNTDLPPGARPCAIERRAPGRLRQWEHDRRLPLDIAAAAPDVFHSPGLDPPSRIDRPWVQTIHDLIPLTWPHARFRKERRRWHAVFERVATADAVVAVSRHTADEAIRVLGLDPARVHVIPHGVDQAFRPPEARCRPDPPYVLYVGVYGPHKGYAEAMALVAELARRGHPHRLKVVGGLDLWSDLEVRRSLTLADRPDRVDLLGAVPEDDLVELYAGADALVMTTRAEGFGLPALEAMATGTPVVAFRNTSLPEVIGDAGVLVADGDVAKMADELTTLLDRGSRWEELSAAGVARAGQFRWERSAAAHAEVYASVERVRA